MKKTAIFLAFAALAFSESKSAAALNEEASSKSFELSRLSLKTNPGFGMTGAFLPVSLELQKPVFKAPKSDGSIEWLTQAEIGVLIPFSMTLEKLKFQITNPFPYASILTGFSYSIYKPFFHIILSVKGGGGALLTPKKAAGSLKNLNSKIFPVWRAEFLWDISKITRCINHVGFSVSGIGLSGFYNLSDSAPLFGWSVSAPL